MSTRRLFGMVVGGSFWADPPFRRHADCTNDTMREMTLAVVGIDFPNPDRSNRRFELALLRPGDPVTLRREPRNRHDPSAVAVVSERGIQLGYLSAERCGWIGRRLAAGEEACAVLQGVRGSAAFIRVRLGGGAPTLPEVAAVAEDVGEGDFLADADGPDWGA